MLCGFIAAIKLLGWHTGQLKGVLCDSSWCRICGTKGFRTRGTAPIKASCIKFFAASGHISGNAAAVTHSVTRMALSAVPNGGADETSAKPLSRGFFLAISRQLNTNIKQGISNEEPGGISVCTLTR